jgi:hypothetical protein
MPSWVVPSVAAEIWGMTVEQILRKIQAGELEVMRDNGWVFVNVAPGGPMINPIKRVPRSERPRTYTVVTREEEEALRVTESVVELEEEPHPDPEPEVSTFTNWRKARQRTARIRLAPPQFASV